MIYGNGHFTCPLNFYCYKVSLREMNSRRIMGIDRYKSGGGGCICVDRWKRSHVGIAVDIEYESVMHRRT